MLIAISRIIDHCVTNATGCHARESGHLKGFAVDSRLGGNDIGYAKVNTTNQFPKIFFWTVFFLFISHSFSFAFLYEVQILDRAAISKFSDEALIEKYIDVMIELEASKAFHERAGFTPKEYQHHKSLIRFRVNIIREIQKRKLEIPKINP